MHGGGRNDTSVVDDQFQLANFTGMDWWVGVPVFHLVASDLLIAVNLILI